MSMENGTAPRNRLYRNPQRGRIFGVCAVFAFPIVCGSYLVLGLMLPRRDSESGDAYDPVQRQVRSDPHDMLSSVRYRFRDLDARLQRLEKYVTSNRFQLDSEFRRLKG